MTIKYILYYLIPYFFLSVFTFFITTYNSLHKYTYINNIVYLYKSTIMNSSHVISATTLQFIQDMVGIHKVVLTILIYLNLDYLGIK